MNDWTRFFARLGCGLSLCAFTLGGCTVPTSEDAEAEPIASVQQPLVTMSIRRETAVDSDGYARVSCDGDFAMGNGSDLVGGEITSQGPTWKWDPTHTLRLTTGAAAKADADNDFVWAQAVCTPAPMFFFAKQDTDGDATANCGTGATAVGGGGYCHNSSARLKRSRPNPTSGKPTGWRATCTTGKVTTGVVCALDDSPDYKPVNCEVKKATSTSSAETVHCDSDQYAVAAGAYCRRGSHIRLNMLHDGLGSAAAFCSTPTGGSGDHVNSYAVCCKGVQLDE